MDKKWETIMPDIELKQLSLDIAKLGFVGKIEAGQCAFARKEEI